MQTVTRVSDGKVYQTIADAAKDNGRSANYIRKECKTAYYKNPEWRYGEAPLKGGR